MSKFCKITIFGQFWTICFARNAVARACFPLHFGLEATPFAQTQLPEIVFQCTSCVYNGLEATPLAILFRCLSIYKSYHCGAERMPRLAVVVRGLHPATGCIGCRGGSWAVLWDGNNARAHARARGQRCCGARGISMSPSTTTGATRGVSTRRSDWVSRKSEQPRPRPRPQPWPRPRAETMPGDGGLK